MSRVSPADRRRQRAKEIEEGEREREAEEAEYLALLRELLTPEGFKREMRNRRARESRKEMNQLAAERSHRPEREPGARGRRP